MYAIVLILAIYKQILNLINNKTRFLNVFNVICFGLNHKPSSGVRETCRNFEIAFDTTQMRCYDNMNLKLVSS